jgi:quercetin dioxygenase-like cupin family protein
MQDRRTFLALAPAAAAAAALLPVGLDAQTASTSGQKPSGELARHTLTGPLEGFDAVLLERNFAPVAGNAHRHPGIVLGYVLEGQLRFAINNEPERIVPAGGTFFEPMGAVHTTNGSANPNAPARVLVFLVVPKGSAIIGPA